MKYVSAFLTGAIFSIGLAISGMIKPSKVEGFLDFTGNWDPTLVFVMGGALAVFLPTYRWVIKKDRPLVETRFDVSTRNDISWQLVTGSVIFGAGWGISGFCPAAAITAFPGMNISVFGVIFGMAIGILGMRTLRSILASQPSQPMADF